MHRSSLSLCSIVVVALGCARISTEQPPPTVHEQSVDASRTKSQIELPELSDDARAYLADCHHRFQKQADESDAMVDECLWRAFDQNCSPDPSGCWDAGQACRDACGTPCQSCDDACGGGCDGCMGKCTADDEACRQRCAEERVGCRDACVDARDKCAEQDCSAAEEKCNADHLAKREQKCPRCGEINDCMNKAIEQDKDPATTCSRKFKREPAECFEWCFEW